MELTSSSIASVDRGEKKRIYGKVLHVPEYFIYDPLGHGIEAYRLGPDLEYERIAPGPDGRIESRTLKLWFGVGPGRLMGYDGTFLRMYEADGKILPTAEEAKLTAEAAKLKAEEEKKQAEAAKLKAEEKSADLAARLAAYEQQFGPLKG